MQNKHHSASRFRVQSQNTKLFNRVAQGYAWDADDDLKGRTAKRNFDFRRLTFGLPILAGIAILGVSLKNSFATTTYTARQDSGSYILKDADYNSEKVESLYGLSSTTIPASFSLADSLTIPVENQGSLDLCVLFATNKAAETNYALTSGTSTYLNLSERYLDYYMSTEVTGSRAVASSVANRPALTALETKGSPLETSFDFSDHTIAEFNAAAPALRVTDSIAFPNISGSSHKSEWYQVLKAHIMKYGAITADLVAPDSTTGNYNTTTFAYNYVGTGSQDHDVAIIGWDDNYAASNFTNAPSTNGAFIAVNSWGSSWGNNGLFYISYESAQFLSYPFGVLSTAQASDSTTVSHDKYLFSEDYVRLDHNFYGVILDVNGENQYLSHIGFGLGSQNGTAVNIYLNPTAGTFDTDSLILLEQKSLDYSQNALTLDHPIHLTGDKFALVFEYTGEDLTHSVANRSVDTFGTTNTYLTGSMYTADSLASTWDVIDNFQFPVVAYTTTRSVTDIAITTAPTQTVYSVGQSLDISGMMLTITYSDGTTSRVSASSLDLTTSGYDPVRTGVQTITVNFEGKTDTFNITVTDAEATIAWKTLPTRRTFQIGEDLNVSGGSITVTYTDEGLETVVPLTSSNISITGYDKTTAGSQTLTVTYLDKTLTYDVVVGSDPDSDNTDETTPASDGSDMSSADEEADKFPDDKISAPDTGVFSHVTVTTSATTDNLFLPISIILVFGGLLTYDLIRRH
ncbi:MAG: bacterial Ig-like domain-containing protein [Candidatus Saccharibacteria bacterium]|nr:bacterial Ig-like domain-containing protein [Candidatus Saccharibacteria bacterium]